MQHIFDTICVLACDDRAVYEKRMPSQEVIAQAIREWIAEGLKQKGKTQRGLADAMGVAQPRISEILRGDRQVAATELYPISVYLGMPIPKSVGLDADYAAAWSAMRKLSPEQSAAIIQRFNRGVAAMNERHRPKK